MGCLRNTSNKKYHDLWACFLYLIIFSVFGALVFFVPSQNYDKIIMNESSLYGPDLRELRKKTDKTQEYVTGPVQFAAETQTVFYIGDFLKMVVLPLVVFSLSNLFYCVFPFFCMHMTHILSILVSFPFGLHQFLKTPSSFFVFLLFSILTLISLILYITVFSRIRYLGNTFRASMRTLLNGAAFCIYPLALFSIISLYVAIISGKILLKIYDVNTSRRCGFFLSGSFIYLSVLICYLFECI